MSRERRASVRVFDPTPAEVFPHGEARRQDDSRAKCEDVHIITRIPGTPGRARDYWKLASEGVTHIEDAGEDITVRDMTDLNASLQGLGLSFPGADDDDNSWSIYWQAPLDWDNTKPVTITIQAIPE